MTDSRDSHLALPNLGYDFVTAVTQNSINAAIIYHLDFKQQKAASVCFSVENGKQTYIPFEELLKRTDGTDPFMIEEFPKDKKPGDDPRIQNLITAKFLRGFRCRLGNPPMTDDDAVPDFVTLGGDTKQVNFKLLWAECAVVEYRPATPGYFEAKRTHRKQRKDDPWIFEAKIDLRLDPTVNEGYGKLPKDIQDRIKNLGDTAFSVEQLIFDFTNASLSGRPKWVNSDDDLGQMLTGGPFTGKYYDILRERGEPLLGCVIKNEDPSLPEASLDLTDFDFKVCPFLDSDGKAIEEQGLATLNYLWCRRIENRNPPTWNWLTEAEGKDKHGVISINRNTFAEYLRPTLERAFLPNCLAPWVSCTYSSGGVEYRYRFDQKETETDLEQNPEGDTIFEVSWHKKAYDASKLLAAFTINVDYTANVKFEGNAIIVTQHIDMYLSITADIRGGGAHVIQEAVTDTNTFGVAHGKLQFKSNHHVNDTSEPPLPQWEKMVPGFELAIQNFIDKVKRRKNALENFTLPIISDFVFPGGKTFSHQEAKFSKYQDLVCNIRYMS